MKKIAVLLLTFVFLTTPVFAGTVNLPRTGQTKCYDEAGSEINCSGTGQDGEIQAGVAWPVPRFTTNADTTITDNLTGLVWGPDGNVMPTRDPGWDTDWKKGETPNDGAVTWQHALDYVAKLNSENYLGHSDWRLPNVNELESLVNGAEANPAAWLNAQGFTKVQAHNYWSSTSYVYYPGYAWIVYMWSGHVHDDGKSDWTYVWPVRAGQTGSFENSVISLPQTGQTKCYDTAGVEISCTGTGQDGEIQAGAEWPEPRFTVNGDVVTDNLTGLMWTKNANLLNGYRTWQQALDYIKGMNNGAYYPNFGYTDWRLPNREELHSLIDFSQYNPALPSGHPFTNVQDDFYWSSTTYTYTTENTWVVMMYDGNVVNYINKSGKLFVWPVRGGQGATLCTYSISPVSQSFPASGGTGSVSITTQSGCTWVATSNASWITITLDSSGTGNGTVSYSVSANNGTTQRTGTMTIEGKTFTVTQEGNIECKTWSDVINAYQQYVNNPCPSQ